MHEEHLWICVRPVVVRRQPFIAHVCIGQLDVFVIHDVVEKHHDFHLVMIDHGARLFFYPDLQRQIGLRVWVGCFLRFDFRNAHDCALRFAADIFTWRNIIFRIHAGWLSRGLSRNSDL